MWKIFEYLGLLLAFALIIAGTALMWNDRGNIILGNSDEEGNQFNWDGATFWIAWGFAFSSVFFRSTMLAVLAAGMTVAFSIFYVNNWFSWGQVNKCRRLDQHDGTNGSSTHRCAGGGIIMYAGMMLALLIAFSPYGWMAAPSVVPRLITIGALLVCVVGLVVIWSSEAVDTSNAAYSVSIDATVLAMLAMFYTLAGTFGYNVPLRGAAGFVSAFAFVMIFHFMFDAENNVDGINPSAQIYAGFILTWISMLLCMVVSVLLFYGQSFATTRAPETEAAAAAGQPAPAAGPTGALSPTVSQPTTATV